MYLFMKLTQYIWKVTVLEETIFFIFMKHSIPIMYFSINVLMNGKLDDIIILFHTHTPLDLMVCRCRRRCLYVSFPCWSRGDTHDYMEYFKKL